MGKAAVAASCALRKASSLVKNLLLPAQGALSGRQILSPGTARGPESHQVGDQGREGSRIPPGRRLFTRFSLHSRLCFRSTYNFYLSFIKYSSFTDLFTSYSFYPHSWNLPTNKGIIARNRWNVSVNLNISIDSRVLHATHTCKFGKGFEKEILLGTDE